MSQAAEASVEQLIADALSAPRDSDQRWEQVVALQNRGDQPTFEAAVDLCESPDPHRRELGVDVLAQLGGVNIGGRPFREPAVELFLDLLSHEQDPRVIAAIATGFGHLEDDRSIEPLARLATHESDEVRYGVVFGLLTRDSDVAVNTLVQLSCDPDSDVRDWATFGLGTQIDRDTPQVREALAARLDDSDEDTREEAIAGLAARGDERAIEPLVALLAAGWESMTLDEALYNLGARLDDARLTPHLANRWTLRSAQAEFNPRKSTSATILLAAARRHGLTDATADEF